MFKKLVFTLALGLSLYASNLSVSNSAIMAQTEVFRDSQITPITRDIKGELTIENSLESIRGNIYFKTIKVNRKVLNENSKYGNHADDGVSKSGIAYDYVIDNNGTKVDLTKEVYNNFIYKEDLFR